MKKVTFILLIAVILNLPLGAQETGLTFLNGPESTQSIVIEKKSASDSILEYYRKLRPIVTSDAIERENRKLSLQEMRIGLSVLVELGLGPIVKTEFSPTFFITLKKKAAKK